MNGTSAKLALATLASVALAATGCGDREERGSAPPPKSAQPDAKTSSKTGPFNATLTASTHRPTAGKPWRWAVEVETRDGKPLAATARLLYLFGGQVVGRGGRREFVGDRRGTLRWPQRSVGFPLTFRIAISTSRGRLELDYPVQVRGSG